MKLFQSVSFDNILDDFQIGPHEVKNNIFFCLPFNPKMSETYLQ